VRRFGYRIDENHRVIKSAFDDLGFSVMTTAKVGAGVPDLVVAKFGKTIAVEIKTEDGALNDDQIKFMETWLGRYRVVRSIGDVVTLENELREEIEGD